MKRTLDGLRVMLTRPASAGDELGARLRERGAIVLYVPLIEIRPAPDTAALRAAAQAADDHDWVAFTSANGVAAFAKNRQKPLPPHVRLAAVGPATAAAIKQQLGRRADLVPDVHNGAALGSALAAAAGRTARISVFQAQDARPDLTARLNAAGLDVTVTTAYATMQTPPGDLGERLREADVIVLSSGSGVRALATGLGADLRRALTGKTVVCIGSVTARAARRAGIDRIITASTPAPDSVLEAIETS